MSENLKLLVRLRGSVKQKLTNCEKYLNSIKQLSDNNKPKFSDLEIRYENYSLLLKEFSDVQMEIESKCDDDQLLEQFSERDLFEERYYTALSSLKEYLIWSENSSSAVKTSDNLKEDLAPQFKGVKLPTINLPIFTGVYDHWLEFKDTFNSLIHTNMSISTIQKFHYLRASLEGDAARIIHSLEFSTANYNTAWDLLCQRFDNTRLLIHNHVKAIFDLESIFKESSIQLRQLIDNLSKHLRALATLNQPTNQWDTLIIYIITSKIDKATLREWEALKVEGELPTLNELFTFLRSKSDLLETLQIGSQAQLQNSSSISRKNNRHNNFSVTNAKCNFCKGPHLIYNCESFLKLDIPTRTEKILNLKLCVNCLRTGHSKNKCQFGSCRRCKEKHNTLLHQERSSMVTTISDNSTQVNMCSSINSLNSQVLLSTVIVKVKDFQGNFHPCRALLDSGAQSNFLTEQFSTKLNLPLLSTNMAIVGINQVVSNIKKRCDLTISSKCNNFTTSLSCFVIPTISGELPHQSLNISKWNIPQNIHLADPDFQEPREVDMLIGVGLFWDLLVDGQIRLGKGMPILKNTKLGWIISGNIPVSISASYCNFSKILYHNEDEQLKKFWELEQVPSCPLMSDDDVECETFFQQTTSRDDTGRFIVKYPLKHPINLLGDSKATAIKRFYSLERKFQLNINFKNQYKQFIDEYESLGHLSKLDISDISNDISTSYYLPHHGILKESSLTTKFRVVFDGSCSTTSGWSFNDLQFVGPKIQNDIFSILIRFRKHAFVVSADITKMYRQILINPHDRPLQRIIWRENSQDDISILQLNTVTYGTTAAPYLAIRCLNQLGLENKIQFPLSSQIILNDFYVDDLLTGSDNLQELNTICLEIDSILKSGGFVLRKWISNNVNVLRNIDDSNNPTKILHLGENESSKNLGIQWITNSDKLRYHISCFQPTEFISKRQILSDISQIYDPLGLLSPCTILSKIIIQKLWSLNLDWDENVPKEWHTKWCDFRSQLTQLNNLTIPRCAIDTNCHLLDIHCFCDASLAAYSTSIYLRSQDDFGKLHVHLLCAKTKVAPLKSVSIPRLELCAALLGAQLMEQVIASLSISTPRYFWTDSQVTICWIKTQPNLLQTFVGNRVSKIQGITNKDDWHYVNTKHNPADIASRGVLPNKLMSSTIWWCGPQFLNSHQCEWPITSDSICQSDIPELKRNSQVFPVITEKPTFSLFSRFSSADKLKRVTSYCFRFIHNSKLKLDKRNFGPLSIHELEYAWLQLIKIAQEEHFHEEISTLKKVSSLHKKHRLSSLAPFIDDDGLLRVGGRLQLSSFSPNVKHPLLLSSKHNLTKLIFNYEHKRLLHAGPQLLLATIRQKYWPISGRNLAKATVKNCIICFKFKPTPAIVPMGNLPERRVVQSFPFEVTGIDYTGAFSIKDRKGRGAKVTKCYICVFVCFSTKAMHLELVTDLSTEIFLASLRRFTSRRGTPSHIYSDNGTTFLGAHNELNALGEFLFTNQNNIVDQTSRNNISWHFIPPYSPNFGGLWESAVKSTKYHLKRIMLNATLTYEEFSTLITQIEAILNSRPLFSISSDPNDLSPITPSHFLIGRTLTTPPDPDLQDIAVVRLSRLQYVQQLMHQFWTRWTKEYVAQLHHQYKWKEGPTNLQAGTLVLINDDKLPPYKWMLGRIQDLCPGKDGICRVATINTTRGLIKRSTRHLCPIPLQEHLQ